MPEQRKSWAQVIAESEARAAKFLAEAPRCRVCRQPMAFGKLTHASCDSGSLVGKICTCPPDCSDQAYGDGPRACDPDCPVCTLMAGKRLRKGKAKDDEP